LNLSWFNTPNKFHHENNHNFFSSFF